MSYSDWKVGDRVVCVDDSTTNHFGERELKRGRTYSIRAISEWGFASNPGRGREICVWLKEVIRYVDLVEDGEVPFRAARFRRVQPRKTDIAVFEAILRGARVPEDA